MKLPSLTRHSRTAIAGCGPGSASARSPPPASLQAAHTRADRPRPRARPARHAARGPRAARPLRRRDAAAREVFGPEDGATVVLAHGWTEALQYWIYVIRALSERGFRVVAYDQRGHGKSEAADQDDYALERFGEDLEAVLTRLRPAGTACGRRRPLARRDVDRRLGRAPRRRAARRRGGAAEHGRRLT